MMRYILLITGFAGLIFSSLLFAGEFGDHCTTGLSNEKMIKTTCNINEIYQGKTYCFGSVKAKEAFLLSPDSIIAKATTYYASHKEPEREKISQADALKQIAQKQCDLSNKDAGYLIFNGLDLRHCNMQNVSFFGAELKGANLSGANLSGAYLNLARLENANFTGANLSNAIIFQAIFSKTNFSQANLSNARMIGTLGNVDMHEANISNGRFGLDMGNQPMGQMKFDSIGGNFAGANFEGADLNIAAFSFGDLRGANLRNTNLFRGDLNKADLTGADLTGANLTDAEIDGAIFTEVKGLSTVKGFETTKGKCVDCKLAVIETETPVVSKSAKLQAEACMMQMQH
ncbi:MAG: LacI family transcriptional regulator [Methylophilales bacterium 28-44-11]|nr:MAG: LacI family transcriptional regulator [Methylophilales bacterium 28-44-11]